MQNLDGIRLVKSKYSAVSTFTKYEKAERLLHLVGKTQTPSTHPASNKFDNDPLSCLRIITSDDHVFKSNRIYAVKTCKKTQANHLSPFVPISRNDNAFSPHSPLTRIIKLTSSRVLTPSSLKALSK